MQPKSGEIIPFIEDSVSTVILQTLHYNILDGNKLIYCPVNGCTETWWSDQFADPAKKDWYILL